MIPRDGPVSLSPLIPRAAEDLKLSHAEVESSQKSMESLMESLVVITLFNRTIRGLIIQ